MSRSPGLTTPACVSQLLSLASDVQDLHLAQQKEMALGFSKMPTLVLLQMFPC